MIDVILKRFDKPDEVRQMEKGKFEIVRLGNMTFGRATYEPGWKWSLHVGPGLKPPKALCPLEHVGMVVAGVCAVAFKDQPVIKLREGELFHIPPIPHDSWVVGKQPYVSIHFLGAEKYAK